MLVKGSLELPGFSTLNAVASQLRGEVNAEMFKGVAGRLSLAEARRLEALLDVVGPSRTTAFNRLKQSAGRASWSAFREQVAHMVWVDSLGDTTVWLEGIAESKIAEFAGEAWAADAAVMGDVGPLTRTALLACAVHVARHGFPTTWPSCSASGSPRSPSGPRPSSRRFGPSRRRSPNASSSTTATCSSISTPGALSSKMPLWSIAAGGSTARLPSHTASSENSTPASFSSTTTPGLSFTGVSGSPR
jgi:hypothetical protein